MSTGGDKLQTMIACKKECFPRNAVTFFNNEKVHVHTDAEMQKMHQYVDNLFRHSVENKEKSMLLKEENLSKRDAALRLEEERVAKRAASERACVCLWRSNGLLVDLTKDNIMPPQSSVALSSVCGAKSNGLLVDLTKDNIKPSQSSVALSSDMSLSSKKEACLMLIYSLYSHIQILFFQITLITLFQLKFLTIRNCANWYVHI